MNRLREDRKRLQWLIDHGYAPAQWRNPVNEREFYQCTKSNGLVFVAKGGRDEIDAAMKRERGTSK